MSDESRLHILNNGRSPAKKSGDLVTRKDVELFVESFANNVLLPKIDEMLKHYSAQVPGLVATMIADALQANNLPLLPPNWKAVATDEQRAKLVLHDQEPEPRHDADAPSAGNEPSDSEGVE